MMKYLKKIKFLKTVTVRQFCTNQEKDFTSFGFKTVKKEERQGLVNSVFANVAEKYITITKI
jgi:hypothetical protein